MTSTVTKLVALSAAAVLGLGLASCSSDDEPKPQASSTSSPSSSTSTSTPVPVSDLDATQAAFFEGVAKAQTKARSSHVEMTIGAAGQTIKASGDVAVGQDPADTSMSMTMDMGSTGVGTLSMILVDRTFYLNFGQVTGNRYGKVDLDDADNPIVKQFGSITDQLDPSQQLDQFKRALTSLEKKGAPETIDGVEAQPYEVVLDTSKVVGLAGTGAAGVPASLTYTMYIGPDDLLRRVTADVGGSTLRADYSRWGEPVDVEAPPADQVSDTALDQLTGS